MTEARPARHRAERCASTPLTIARAAVTDRAPTLSRGSVAIAMSSGLALTGSIPVLAAYAGGDRSPAATASVAPIDPGVTAARGLASGTATRLAPGALTGQPLTAPPVTVRFAPDTTISAVTRPRPAAASARPARNATPAKASRGNRRASPTSGGTTAPRTGTGAPRATTPDQAADASEVLAVAARYVGVPYLYGGTTPAGFDCSGYVRYVYAAVGVSLPRTADQQMRATTQVPRSQARPGDLVSFVSGGRVYHNGIYAGNGMMYDAPKTGGFVSKRAIWTATVVYTRVSRT